MHDGYLLRWCWQMRSRIWGWLDLGVVFLANRSIGFWSSVVGVLQQSHGFLSTLNSDGRSAVRKNSAIGKFLTDPEAVSWTTHTQYSTAVLTGWIEGWCLLCLLCVFSGQMWSCYCRARSLSWMVLGLPWNGWKEYVLDRLDYNVMVGMVWYGPVCGANSSSVNKYYGTRQFTGYVIRATGNLFEAERFRFIWKFVFL